MTESQLLKRILANFNRGPVRLFRNNQGLADYKGILVRYGLCNPGGSDLIGWVVRDGKAIFCAVEVKAPQGVVSAAQARFIDAVQRAGGIAGVVRSEEELAALLGVDKQ